MPLQPKKYRQDPALRAALFSTTQSILALHDRAQIAKRLGIEPSWELCEEILLLLLKVWGSNMTAGVQLNYISSEELDTVLAQIQDRIQILTKEPKA